MRKRGKICRLMPIFPSSLIFMFTIKAFFLGILTASFAFVLEQTVFVIFSLDKIVIYSNELNFLLIAAIVTEEITKYAVIYKTSKEYASKQCVLYNAFLIGLGFSSLEISFHLLKLGSFSPSSYLPLGGIIFIHSLTALFMGFFIHKNRQYAGASHLYIIVSSLFLHTLYNLIILYEFQLFKNLETIFRLEILFNQISGEPVLRDINDKLKDPVIGIFVLFVAFILYQLHRIGKNLKKIFSLVK